ncbi:MAG TPA: polysaccharide deacetylase family protein [Actinomycetaceae bacterium]|nr:polysaccharide deacetylase family protein [Actinomycetaceae bacterium]
MRYSGAHRKIRHTGLAALLSALLVLVGVTPASAEGEALPFSDVPEGTQFYTEIMWMRAEGISTGWADNTYRPWEPVNRDAMAAFMYRLAGSPAFDVSDTSPFTDVPEGTQFYTEIMWMRAEGISTGWADNTYRPSEPVNRDAMAAFMYRLAGSPAFDVSDTSPFTDVPERTQFYTEIMWMRAEGISTGWADNTYRPLEPVNRDAMAAFMYRLAGMTQPEQLTITTASLRSGTVGQPYEATLAATGGTTPYTWKTTNLPAGLTLTGNKISGTPTSDGTKNPQITVTDSAGQQRTRTLALKINPYGDVNCDVLKCIALTFDDGPAPYTNQVLDALTASGSRATFFLTGSLIKSRIGEVERMADLGMEIGNHSYDHIYLTEQTPTDLYWQLWDTNYYVRYYTGVSPTVFRPPYGYRNASVDAEAGRQGMAVVLWTDDPFDYEYKANEGHWLREDVVDLASRDAVILLHDDVAATAAALPGIISDLQARGYTLVTVTDIIGNPVAGKLYFDH